VAYSIGLQLCLVAAGRGAHDAGVGSGLTGPTVASIIARLLRSPKSFATPLMAAGSPLVSIIMFCRNAAPTIRRALDSVVNGTYPNIEVVIQDGASTDGTVDIIRSYNDSRLKLVSEPDNGPTDAFRRALRRYSGALIASCQADEELLPDAVARAAAEFVSHPGLGGLLGDALVTDANGTVTGKMPGRAFDIVEYLFGDYAPYFGACFFARQALADVGMFDADVNYSCFEFEIWTRLAFEHELRYQPETFAKYAVHERQLSNTAPAILEHIHARASVIARLFSTEGFFGGDARLREFCLLCQYKQFYAHAITYSLEAVRSDLEARIGALSKAGGGDNFAEEWLAQQRARRYWLAFGNLFPPRLKRQILEHGLHRAVRPLFLKGARLLLSRDQSAVSAPAVAATDRARLIICHEIALRYEARGQINQALQLWRRAEALDDAAIDSYAVQAAQKSPLLSLTEQLAIQSRWAARHAPSRTVAMPVRASSQPINVGYHCVWWDSPVARHQLLNFIHEHDRTKVRLLCYSPVGVPHDIAREFSVVRIVENLSDEAFAEQVREDQVDILVETTGFSPHHRYAAMGHRCAPVQISYLNHHATSAVPNVDYVLGDAIAAGGDDVRYYSEEVYRLPGCFFCFDLRHDNIAFTEEPPSLRTGTVTFGCFGSGGKINLALIELWSEILKAVPGSRMFVRNRELSSADNRRFMVRRFARFGIGADRLTLMGGADHRTILASYADVDVSLDTWPYCGGNTIAESMWQGVPVVTLLGDRFSSRYGASLLRAHGCDDFVATSAKDYVGIAMHIAQDVTRRVDLRKQLREMTATYGFNNSRAFARKLEDAYATMLSAARTGSKFRANAQLR
jgi:glycosyltransferase involved in cell wall biosynthesis